MNIFGKNIAGSLMKTTDLWYMALTGFAPAAVTPPTGYSRTRRGSGKPFLSSELTCVQSPP